MVARGHQIPDKKQKLWKLWRVLKCVFTRELQELSRHTIEAKFHQVEQMLWQFKDHTLNNYFYFSV